MEKKMKKCNHHPDYIMGCGDDLYCGVCKIKQLERDKEVLIVCLDHAMDVMKNPDYDATKKLANLLRGLAALKEDKK
jgi:hypothetical protein